MLVLSLRDLSAYALCKVPKNVAAHVMKGCIFLMPRTMGLAKACEHVFTGDFLKAKDVERPGILNRLVLAEDLEKETMQLAQKMPPR